MGTIKTQLNFNLKACYNIIKSTKIVFEMKKSLKYS